MDQAKSEVFRLVKEYVAACRPEYDGSVRVASSDLLDLVGQGDRATRLEVARVMYWLGFDSHVFRRDGRSVRGFVRGGWTSSWHGDRNTIPAPPKSS